ncbi:MAG TPA: winged helix DNA-binding domain-containing protein [Chitinophagaceae bacterium]|jgi:winged helix DNA-binding protein|nr:winged helix DNA-binding domain-containing protein [Chitinophagaceae bacterium]
MTSSDIIKLRLFNQQIVETKYTKPGELVSWMGAIQAQDYSMAKWAIGLRLPGSDDTSIEKSFNEGKILRTHVLRPTWHFVTPQDIRWMIELTAPRVLSSLVHNDRHLSLDKKVLKKTNDVLAKALEGGKQLTRDEVRSALQRARIDTSGLRFMHLLEHAELDRVICSGAKMGTQFTYALFDERASAKTMERDEALAELTKRFFTSRGPATIYDFAWWSGLSVADAKKGIEMVKRKLKREIIDGREYFFRIPPSFKDEMTPTALLLPNYDEYVLSYKDRTESIDKKHLPVILKERNAVFTNAILINGKIEGLWHRSIKNNAVAVTTRTFSAINKIKQKLVTRAVSRYCKFLGKSLQA